MKTIDEYKKEILLGIMSESIIDWDYIVDLPINDELRTFMCELGPIYSFLYAANVDECPNDETRKGACREPRYAYGYAYYIDKSPHAETRRAALKSPYLSYEYAVNIDKCPREDTREACYRDPGWKEEYIRWLGE